MAKTKRRIDERISHRDDHGTPKWLIDRIADFGRKGIGLDPAGGRGTPASRAATVAWYGRNSRTGRGIDGLRNPWRGYGLVFCNPEYGVIVRAWAQKAIDAFSPSHGREITSASLPSTIGRTRDDELLMFVAARVNARWFRALTRHAAATLYLDKRVQFIGEPDDAKFPSALVYFGASATDHRADQFAASFSDLGTIYYSGCWGTGSYNPRSSSRAMRVQYPGRLPAPSRTPSLLKRINLDEDED